LLQLVTSPPAPAIANSSNSTTAAEQNSLPYQLL